MIQLRSIIKPEQLFWRQVCMTSLAQIWQCGLCFSVLSEAPAKFCLMKGCTTSMLMSMPWTAKAGIAKNNRIHTNPLFSLTVFDGSLTKSLTEVSLRFSTFLYVSQHVSGRAITFAFGGESWPGRCDALAGCQGILIILTQQHRKSFSNTQEILGSLVMFNLY